MLWLAQSKTSTQWLGWAEQQPVAILPHEDYDEGRRYTSHSSGIGYSRHVQIGKGNKMPRHYRAPMPPGYRVPDWKYLPHRSMGRNCRPGHPRDRAKGNTGSGAASSDQYGYEPQGRNMNWWMQLEYQWALSCWRQMPPTRRRITGAPLRQGGRSRQGTGQRSWCSRLPSQRRSSCYPRRSSRP